MSLSALVRPLLAAALGGGLSLGTPAAHLHRTITKAHSIVDYPAGTPVIVFRGGTSTIFVYGQFLNLATGVDVLTSSGALASSSDVSATITNRVGGANTYIWVDVAARHDYPLGIYKLVFHYTVQVNGADTLPIRLLERGRVDRIKLVSATPKDSLVVGQRYTFQMTGDGLQSAHVRVQGPYACRDVTSETHTSTTYTFTLGCDRGGDYAIMGSDVWDLALDTLSLSPSDLQAFRSQEWFGGDGEIVGQAWTVPVVTSLSPRITTVGAPVSGSGVNIAAPISVGGGTQPATGTTTPQLRYVKKYLRPGDARAVVVGVGFDGSGGLSFTAPSNVNPDSLTLVYQSSAHVMGPVPVPSLFVVEAPKLTSFPAAHQLTGGGTTYNVITAPTADIVGSNIQRPTVTNTSPLTIAHPTTIAARPSIGTVLTAASASPPVTITVGSHSFSLSSQTYDATRTQSDGTQGADILHLSVPPLPATEVGTLTVTTGGGSATLPNVLLVAAPQPTTIKEVTAAGLVDVVGLALKKGHTYELQGTALNVTVPPVVLQAGVVKFNGVSLLPPATLASTGGAGPTGATLRFIAPSTAGSGQLTVQNLGGSTVVGTFTVQ